MDKAEVKADLRQTFEGVLAAGVMDALELTGPYEVGNIAHYDWDTVKLSVSDPFGGEYDLMVRMRNRPGLGETEED